MPVAANSGPTLARHEDGGWWFEGWGTPRLLAGVTDRRFTPDDLVRDLGAQTNTVEAEQVHGASLAVIEHVHQSRHVVPGCDALLTERAGLALLMRTADCLPIFIVDPLRGAIGIAHAGWRGLAAQLPARVIAAFHHVYHSRAEDLAVAIGPAIHACCYEVGPEFIPRFGAFVKERGGRRTCDLIGVAMSQLRGCGVRQERIFESAHCTACEPQHWFSVRREGDGTGRLTSFIMLRP